MLKIFGRIVESLLDRKNNFQNTTSLSKGNRPLKTKNHEKPLVEVWEDIKYSRVIGLAESLSVQ